MSLPSAYSKRPDGTIGTSSLGNINAGLRFPDPDQTDPDSDLSGPGKASAGIQYGGARRLRKADRAIANT
jgi:hypothetical protein